MAGPREVVRQCQSAGSAVNTDGRPASPLRSECLPSTSFHTSSSTSSNTILRSMTRSRRRSNERASPSSRMMSPQEFEALPLSIRYVTHASINPALDLPRPICGQPLCIYGRSFVCLLLLAQQNPRQLPHQRTFFASHYLVIEPSSCCGGDSSGQLPIASRHIPEQFQLTQAIVENASLQKSATSSHSKVEFRLGHHRTLLP